MTLKKRFQSQCVDYLENICKMFVNGSKNCEGQALEYQQMYISAIRHAIAKLQSSVRNGEVIKNVKN